MTELASTSNGPVLVAVDFSPHSEAALVWAAKTARSFSVPLVILHVVHDPAESPGYYQRALKKATGHSGTEQLRLIQDLAREAMAEFLEGAVERHPELAPVEELDTRLEPGVPVTRVLEVADALGASQIVMGSQGRTGLSEVLLGSKAKQVVRFSKIPVTIVKQ